MKICTECLIEKSLDAFWFNVKKNKYQSKKYKNITPEKKAIYDKRYREKYSDELKISKKDEYERNKAKYITRH